MCFEVPALVPQSMPAGGNENGADEYDGNDNDLGIMDIDGDDRKSGKLKAGNLSKVSLASTFQIAENRISSELCCFHDRWQLC